MRTTVVLGLLLMLTPGVSADYLQSGYDAARTGFTPDAGPVLDDVALRVFVPGSRTPSSTPLIVGDEVVVAVGEGTPTGAPPGEGGPFNFTGLVAVDVRTGAWRIVVETVTPVDRFASDGQRAFAVDGERITVYELSDGSTSWAVDHQPPGPTGVGDVLCGEPVVERATVYVWCHAWGPLPHAGVDSRFFARAIDASSGEVAWTWEHTVDRTGSPEEARPPLAVFPPRSLHGQNVVGTALVGSMFLAITIEHGRNSPTGHVWALDAATGALSWVEPFVLGAHDQGPNTAPPTLRPQQAGFFPGHPTGDGQVAYVAVTDLVALDAATGSLRWQEALPQSNPNQFGGTAFALGPQGLFVAAHDTLRLFDADARATEWSYVLGADEHFDDQPLVLMGGVLYARAHPEERPGENTLYAIDPGEGRLLWRHVFVQDPERRVTDRSVAQFTLAYGRGLVAAAGADGSVTVLGRSAASLRPVAEVSTRHPGPGEPVAVDLSGSGAGATGPPSEFRALWGDGTNSGWQTSPTFTHAYSERRAYEARFQVRNDAGQTSSEFVRFDVGGSAPNLLETAFARDNQDLTFGVLGVGLALAGGVIAVGRNRRRSGRLQRELTAIDEAAEAAGGNTVRLRAAMEERRAHCRGLLLNRRIEESQFAVLERHIEAIARGQRLEQMHDLFDVLPHGIVRALEDALADGRITTIEREGVLRLVERNNVLTDPQKRRVASLIEGWFAQDEGGAV